MARPRLVAALLIATALGTADFQAVSQSRTPPAQAGAAPDLARVHLIATGGTISNRSGKRLTVDELIASLPAAGSRVRVTGEQFANVSSGAMSLAQWLDLSRRINERFRADAGLAGVVVTSGTDTLEELAYFLHLTVRDERPVVVVGSMRTPSAVGYEGAANLEDGVVVAADPQARGMGALVVLNDEIHSAREVTKTDARALDTFRSGHYGALGTIFDRVVFFRKPVRRHSATSEFDVTAISELPRVDVLLAYQGAPGDLIRAAVDHGAKGIVIAGVGTGGTSGTQGQGIAYATQQDAFVVTTTRTGSGSVGAGRRGAANRRVSGDDLQPVKARVLLMLALATTTDPAQVQRMFREY